MSAVTLKTEHSLCQDQYLCRLKDMVCCGGCRRTTALVPCIFFLRLYKDTRQSRFESQVSHRLCGTLLLECNPLPAFDPSRPILESVTRSSDSFRMGGPCIVCRHSSPTFQSSCGPSVFGHSSTLWKINRVVNLLNPAWGS